MILLWQVGLVNISASHNTYFLSVSERTVSFNPKNQITVSVGYLLLVWMCVNTHLLRRESEHCSLITDEPSASAADPQTLPPSLCLTHSLCRSAGPSKITTVSVLLRRVTLLCPLGVEGDWCFYIGPKHFSGVCKYIFFRAMIMWHIWSGTPFVKVHKRLCAPGRLMKQTCRAARIIQMSKLNKLLEYWK